MPSLFARSTSSLEDHQHPLHLHLSYHFHDHDKHNHFHDQNYDCLELTNIWEKKTPREVLVGGRRNLQHLRNLSSKTQSIHQSLRNVAQQFERDTQMSENLLSFQGDFAQKKGVYHRKAEDVFVLLLKRLAEVIKMEKMGKVSLDVLFEGSRHVIGEEIHQIEVDVSDVKYRGKRTVMFEEDDIGALSPGFYAAAYNQKGFDAFIITRDQ
eukprot:CAMPEP_0201533414 /NCGR_PEP_ID=MMETSP0161_2-20130828/53179_1 /ASSEMBLY_ACC=CAM_ASM_000251 /TAXON_ID=180227 /ORGANISM="Neoparamoeba aestuarina, Strain SoJaBio B1-5/56/2" /LENGTH=209 /DNA_ID=CAMNT_0047937423 /DNA_START=176 /DNA_END=805 /DNA_ORIENTATION=+